MSEQSRYWNEMVDLKRDAIYMALYAQRTETIDRWIEGTKAVAGVGSLGSWAYFKTYPEIWASIIVISQVFAALKEQLPYKKTLKSTSGLCNDLSALLLSAENDWFDVANGSLENEQIHKLRMALKRKIFEASKARFGDGQLATKTRLVEKANLAAAEYFATYIDE